MDFHGHQGEVDVQQLRIALRRAGEGRSKQAEPTSTTGKRIQTPKERGFWLVIQCVSGFCGILGVGIWIFGAFASDELSRQERLARIEGVPLTPNDIILPPVPASQDAAPLYRKSFELTQGIRLNDPEVPSSASVWWPTVYERSRWETCRPYLVSAANLAYCRLVSPAASDAERSLVEKKVSVLFKLLSGTARWREIRGDLPGAMDEYKLKAKVIRNLTESGNSRQLNLSAYRYWGTLLVQLMGLAARHPESRETIAGIDQAMAALGPFPNAMDQIRPELVFDRQQMMQYRSQGGCYDDECSSSGLGSFAISTSWVSRSLDACQIGANRILMSRMPKDSEDVVGIRAAADAASNWAADQHMPLESLYSAPVETGSGYFSLVGSSLARYRMLKCATRLLSSGKPFPIVLPRWGKDSTDPFTNLPLRYHKTEKGFVLFSVGANGVEDTDEVGSSSGDDIAFVVPPIKKPDTLTPPSPPRRVLYSDD